MLTAGERRAEAAAPRPNDYIATEDATAAVRRRLADPDGLLAGLRNGQELEALALPALRFAVPGLVPAEGLTLLVGAPKRGKSWLALDLALAVAVGGKALGAVNVEPATTLYLALEDSDRRMKARARHLLGPGQPIPVEFHYLTRLANPVRLLDTLRAFLVAHPDTALVIIDTLARVRPRTPLGMSMYQHDYLVASALKDLADAHGIALVVVHHDRKAKSEDYVDDASGSHGLTGAADTIIVLDRPRGDVDGVLKITGRDVEEREYAMRMVGGAWTMIDGPPPDLTLGERSARILAHVNAHPDGQRAEEVATALDLVQDTVRRYLSRLAEGGRIHRADRGHYTPVPSVPSVPSDLDDPAQQDSRDTRDTTSRDGGWE